VNVFAVQPFTLMWGAAKWDIYRDDTRAPEIFARVTTAFTVAGSFVALGAAAFATDIVRILLTPEFEPARHVVPFSAFAAVLYGVYTLAGTGLNVEGRTTWIATIFAAAAALNVGLNLVLIPNFGFMGAAYATIAGYVFLALATGAMSDRYYRIPWQLGPVIGTLAVGFGLGLAALQGPDHALWRAGCFAIFGPILMALRIIRASDVHRLREALVRR
jgi:O-antigen/teichoic acid export membrane protein